MVNNEIDIDRGALERDLKEVGDYLAELRFIDLSLQHIEERSRWRAATESPTDIRQVEVRLGRTYPFLAPPLLTPWYVDPQDELAVLQQFGVQANEWAGNEMDFLGHLVREIMYYPVAGYTPMDTSLESAWSTLNGRVEEDFGYLADEIGDWSGPAASEFKSLFYNKLRIARTNQLQLIRTLQGALEASRRITEYSQQSVINAVAAGREALQEQLYLRSVGDNSSASAKIALLVVGGAFTVLGAVTAGQSLWLAAGLTASGYAAGVAASELPADGVEEREIVGRSAEEVAVGLIDAIREVTIFLGRQFDHLHDELREVHVAVADLQRAHQLLPLRPRLADGVAGEDFYHDSSEQYPRRSR